MQIIAHDTPTADSAEVQVLPIANDADLADLAASGALNGVARIELSFPKFTDGRAYTQAVLLRRRYRFAGDIRATGDVLIDQLVHMQRSGFSSAVLAPGVNAAAAVCAPGATFCVGGRMSAARPPVGAKAPSGGSAAGIAAKRGGLS